MELYIAKIVKNMVTWDWFRKDGLTYFISERSTNKKNAIKFDMLDLVDAATSENYSGLKIKYLLTDEDISILKTTLKNGRWRILEKADLN